MSKHHMEISQGSRYSLWWTCSKCGWGMTVPRKQFWAGVLRWVPKPNDCKESEGK